MKNLNLAADAHRRAISGREPVAIDNRRLLLRDWRVIPVRLSENSQISSLCPAAFRFMNEALALKLLRQIMEWDEETATREYRWIRLMSLLKYDGYAQARRGRAGASAKLTPRRAAPIDCRMRRSMPSRMRTEPDKWASPSS